MNVELTGVDSQIYEYIESKNSFLLFAGAGSGKTRTLVNLLQQIKKMKKDEMLIRGQKVAVITYTNTACDEIQHRLKHDSLFTISTIHSFAWDNFSSIAPNFDIDCPSQRQNNLMKVMRMPSSLASV